MSVVTDTFPLHSSLSIKYNGNMLLTSSLFSQEVYPKNFEGTFIPVDFYNEVLKNKSYSQSIKNTKNIEFYTVVCLRNNNFWSDVKFHDGYLIKEPIKITLNILYK